jgi:GNAT superfamily N-acetyltransferase
MYWLQERTNQYLLGSALKTITRYRGGDNRMKVRKANKEDCSVLSKIALESKAHWGYSDEFLEWCEEELTITTQDIENKIIYLMEESTQTLGFYCISVENKELEALFIRPQYIGKGIGSYLWEDALLQARQYGLSKIKIISDPFAESFYTKMGAEKIGESESSIFQNRRLPILELSIM